MAMNNVTMWNYARAKSPSFKSHTSEGTAELFTEKGFEALKRENLGAINEFFEVSLRVAFQSVTVSRAKNLFENKGLVEVYDTPNGGYVQRMAIDSLKPVSPAFKGLEDGDGPDPFVVRKPSVKERFFAHNFDFQSLLSLQDFQVKTIFVSEYGMNDFIAGCMQALRNGYTVQESLNVKEAINAALNSNTYPLQSTQKYELSSWTDGAETAAELTAFILGVKTILTAMTITEQSSAYNAGKFTSAIDTNELVLVMRAGIRDKIAVNLEVGAFNPDRLSLPLEIIETDSFGGLTPLVNKNTVYPVYDKIGQVIGYSTTEGSKTVTYTDADITGYNDPNDDVLAIICQRGLLFENLQNGYEVIPIYNPRGHYANYWASRPNCSIVVDPYRAMVVIKKPASGE